MNKKFLKRVVLAALTVFGLTMSFFYSVEAEKSVEWEPSDFVYSEMEQTLNGCDYTRQFVISGPVVAGFSESGEEKLKTCTDLVLPSETEDGEKLVGVADNAFEKKGLTSVKFPEGMMVDYDDTVTHAVTKRGNYIIGSGAFAYNDLTEVDLPEGVIAVMSSSFKKNQIASLTFPHTIWWIENSSFAYNELEDIGFPKTCDFQVQIHGFAFSHNKIKSVTLPYYVEVIHKWAFNYNPGMEEYEVDTPEKEKTLGGIVYMYTTNKDLADMERIHHYGRTAESQHSWHQKLIVGEKSAEGNEWTRSDFTYDGKTITGLSASGIEKRKENPDIIFPDTNPQGEFITEIADSDNGSGGLFATAEEKIRSIDLPMKLVSIGKNAFADAGLKKIKGFPASMQKIGDFAFRQNQLTNIILPDTVTEVGKGAFATNPKLESLILSKGLTEIESAAFGCSDNKNYMTNLTEIVIPDTITKIGDRGFAGNNFHYIEIPASVKEIGDYAFSTKNYLSEECTVSLQEGLESIGKYAFRNKVILKIEIPNSVKKIGQHAFLKEYSNGAMATTTRVYVSEEQKYDTENFLASQNAVYIVRGDQWDEYDFTYEVTDAGCIITGLSESGYEKLKENKDLLVSSVDDEGNKVTGIGEKAFCNLGLCTVEFPDTIVEIQSQAFAGNQLQAVWLPESVEIVKEDAFLDNIGVEDAAVYMYVATEKTGILTSSSQIMIVASEFPEIYDAWNSSDFQYSEDGATITGFSENGRKKVEIRSDVTFPARDTNNIIVTTIGKQAFQNCGITEIKLSSKIVEIGESAFEGNLLKTVNLPKSVTTAGKRAFAENTKLQKIELSQNMSVIPEGFADGAAELTELEIPEGICKIEDRAFYGNQLEKLELPDGVLTIGVSAFAQDDTKDGTLQILHFGEGLTSISNKTFANTGVQEVDLPKTVTVFAKDVFENSKGMVANVYVADPSQLKETDDYITKSPYHEMKYSNLACTGWTYGDFTFEGNVITGWSAKGNQTRLQNNKLVLPEINPDTDEKIIEIGEKAFQIPDGEWEQLKDGVYSPTGMVSVKIPDTVEKIGAKAFEYNALVNVEFPNDLQSIGESAFHGNRLISVSIPDSVTTLSDGAFSGNDISSLKLSKSLTKLNSGIFSMNIRLEKVEIPQGVTEIGDMAFSGDRLTSLEIPPSVTKIGRKAFHLHHMTELTIPGTVKEIGESAFEGTPKAITLTKLILEEGIETIGSKAFKCGYLERVTLPNSLNSLAADAFVENAGTNNDHIVVLYTGNKEHLNFAASESHKIQYKGTDSSSESFQKKAIKEVSIKLNVSKKTVSVKISKVADAKSYQVAYRLNGKGEWKTVRANSTSCTLKKISKGTVVEIKARGVRTIDGTTIYTKYSPVTRVLMSRGNLKSAKGAKKAIELKWEKQTGVTGYQISYSTNSKFSGSKNISIKNAKTVGKTIKVSKSKKTYYVKIKSYKTVRGKRYFSAWSYTKKVRSK